jgi:hypothetical protein
MRRRQVDRAAHVVAGEVLARPGDGDRAADLFDDARFATREARIATRKR